MNYHRALQTAALVLVPLCATGDASARNSTTVIHTVLGAILQSGNPGQTLSQGYTTIDTESMQCVYSEGCTLGMTIMSAVSKATCTQKEWAIVALVDGNSVDGGPFVDSLPGSGKTQTRNWEGAYTVSNGTHTITFELYVPCPTTADQWSVDYLITTP